jgi:hypothetical protein
LETEFGTTRVDRVDDAGDVIANDAKSGHFSVIFHGTPQSGLRIFRHLENTSNEEWREMRQARREKKNRVSFIKNDNLVGRTRVTTVNCSSEVIITNKRSNKAYE